MLRGCRCSASSRCPLSGSFRKLAKVVARWRTALFVTAHADEAALARIAARILHHEVLGKPLDATAFRAALRRLIEPPAAH